MKSVQGIDPYLFRLQSHGCGRHLFRRRTVINTAWQNEPRVSMNGNVCILRSFDKGTNHETIARERLAAHDHPLRSPVTDAERRDS